MSSEKAIKQGIGGDKSMIRVYFYDPINDSLKAEDAWKHGSLHQTSYIELNSKHQRYTRYVDMNSAELNKISLKKAFLKASGIKDHEKIVGHLPLLEDMRQTHEYVDPAHYLKSASLKVSIA